MKIIQTIKIVIVSIIALIALTLLTTSKPVKIQKKVIDISNMPKTVELIGYENQKFNTKSIIKKDTFIYVGNQESIGLASELESMLNLKSGKFIIVSNISDAPWFIKRWQAYTKNSKLKGAKNIPWIYDRDGAIRNFLQVPTSDALKYFVYKVDDKGIIQNIFIGKVDKRMNDNHTKDKNTEKDLKHIVNIIKK